MGIGSQDARHEQAVIDDLAVRLVGDKVYLALKLRAFLPQERRDLSLPDMATQRLPLA